MTSNVFSEMPLSTKHASSISEITAAAISIADSWLAAPNAPQELWFRGQCQTRYPLAPSLYRGSNLGFVGEEPSMMARFEGLATPLVQREYDEWEWYFLARHHHVPTRLLDWSESLVVAVRFALSEYCDEMGDRVALDNARRRAHGADQFDEFSPCVWLLDAGGLNQYSVGRDANILPGGDLAAPYLPSKMGESESGALPIALLPRRSNPRLAAQRGMFTVHGADQRPLDELAIADAVEKSNFPLARIILNRGRLAHLLYELEVAGIDRFGLFPDLDRVGEQVCWEYKQG